MSEKENYLNKKSRAYALLKNYGHMENGNVVINPEHEAAKLFMQSGYSKSEAWMEVAKNLEKNKELKRRAWIRNPDRIIAEAYARSGTEEGRKKAKQLIGTLRDSEISEDEGILSIIHHGLEGRVMIIFSAGFLLASLFFFSSKLTGNAVLGLSITNTNIIGVALFVLGILGAMFSFRKK